MQETQHTLSVVGFNMSCWLKGAMLERDYNAEVLLMSWCFSDTSAQKLILYQPGQSYACE